MEEMFDSIKQHLPYEKENELDKKLKAVESMPLK